jgi:protein phosphatase
MRSINIDHFGLTRTGWQRTTNQDQFAIADLHSLLVIGQSSLRSDHASRRSRLQGSLYVVADGMGGHAAGDRASVLALEVFLDYLVADFPWCTARHAISDRSIQNQLLLAARRCDATIKAEAAERPDRSGMGTTLTAAMVIWPKLYVSHVGDSRCYLWRAGQLKQLTTDHTVARQLSDAGVVDPDAVLATSLRRTLWNVMGGLSTEVQPEFACTHLVVDDVLLLCTDGITRVLQHEAISEILTRHLPAPETCFQLVDATLRANGSDDITLVVACFKPPAIENPGDEVGMLSNEEQDDPSTHADDGFDLRSPPRFATPLRARSS